MAIQPTIDEYEFAGAVKLRFLTLEITNYDATNGESFTAEDAGLNRIMQVVALADGGDVFSVGYNSNTQTLKVDVADGSDITLSVLVFGK